MTQASKNWGETQEMEAFAVGMDGFLGTFEVVKENRRTRIDMGNCGLTVGNADLVVTLSGPKGFTSVVFPKQSMNTGATRHVETDTPPGVYTFTIKPSHPIGGFTVGILHPKKVAPPPPPTRENSQT